MTKTETDTSAIPALLEAMSRLTPEERAQLQQRGAVLPHFGAQSIDTPPKYGYRCKHCGRIGVEFIGNQFDNGGGQIQDKPHFGLRFADLPWAQPRLNLSQINRANPTCQHCLATLPSNNGYPIEKYLVDIALHQSARDKAFEKVREARRNSDRSQATHNYDGSPISLSSDYDTTRSHDDAIAKRAFAQAEQDTPGITAAVQELSARPDLPDILARVARPPKGRS